MTTEDIFRRIVEALDRAGISYMLTGSFASSFHGAPRATQDIDIIVAPTGDQIEKLVEFLPSTEFYVDLEAAHDAQRYESMFNVVDLATGWKIDLIMRKSRTFSREEFERRIAVDAFGVRLMVASAEDIVISKLEWAKLGQSDRQVEDVASVLKVRWDSLDKEYMSRWIHELDLDEEWDRARKRAGIEI